MVPEDFSLVVLIVTFCEVRTLASSLQNPDTGNTIGLFGYSIIDQFLRFDKEIVRRRALLRQEE